MKSMTGYGKAVVSGDGRELTVELKSVNHRFLDLSFKLPRMFLSNESLAREIISHKISRGHIDVFVNYRLTTESDKIVFVDEGLANGYVSAAKKLRETFPDLRDDFTITSLMRCSDVLSVDHAEEDETAIREIFSEALETAVDNLNIMRETEGNKLRNDLLLKIDRVEQLLQKITELAPTVTEAYREKLRERVQDALSDVALDEGKLANEICFFADKSCIDEEKTRLSAHIAHAREILRSEESVGRKMDFLVQEFNRETNTICSKSASVELTDTALELKNEIEKIREQVQNLE